MERSVVIYGEPDLAQRTEAYRQILGSEQVSVAAEPSQIAGTGALIDIRGSMACKRSISAWQQSGAFVVTNGPPAATLEESQAMMASADVLLARPSWYHRRYALLRQQLETGQIGELVAVRLIRLMPEDSWLPDGVTLNYAFDAFDAVCSLLGDVKRIMAREQCLKRTVPDALFATVVGKRDAIGYVELCACYPQGYQSERIEVIGREGILEYNSDVNRTLRLNTKQRECVRDAFHEPSLGSMIREYVGMVDDDKAVQAHVAATSVPLRLVYRALASSRQNQPA